MFSPIFFQLSISFAAWKLDQLRACFARPLASPPVQPATRSCTGTPPYYRILSMDLNGYSMDTKKWIPGEYVVDNHEWIVGTIMSGLMGR